MLLVWNTVAVLASSSQVFVLLRVETPLHYQLSKHITSQHEMIAVCAVDQVPVETFDKLLFARDDEWRDDRRSAGKSYAVKDGICNGEKLTPVNDPDWHWNLFIADKIGTDISQYIKQTVPPVTAFDSPWLGMTIEEIQSVLEEKNSNTDFVRDNLFVVVDLRTVEDDTVLMCQTSRIDDQGEPLDAMIVRRLRVRMPALVLALVNLDIANMDFFDFEESAADEGGILEDHQGDNIKPPLDRG